MNAVPDETQISDLAQSFADGPVFTPFTVRPDIKNRNDIARAMEENYPPLLRDAGIGGTVTVWFFLDEEGVTQRTLINESSGQLALDDAALRVADAIVFTPALNGDKRVPVWISLPITFAANREDRPARPATPVRERAPVEGTFRFRRGEERRRRTGVHALHGPPRHQEPDRYRPGHGGELPASPSGCRHRGNCHRLVLP